MRYQVGEKIWAVFFHNKSATFYPMFSTWLPTLPYATKEFPEIEFIELIVTEHHRVPSEWDSKDAEPRYDGFVLTDANGQVWHNQYPYASYGQVSDSNDGRFKLRLKNQRKIAEETIDFVRIRREREPGMEWPKAPHVIEAYDLMRELANITYADFGLREYAASALTDEEAMPHVHLLGKWYAHLIEEFEKHSGLKIESSPCFFTNKEGVDVKVGGHYDFKALDPEKFHVVKSSRAYSGRGYSGPALKSANITLLEAEFDNQSNAESCARKLTAVNPVGFDVYSSKTKECVYRARDTV